MKFHTTWALLLSGTTLLLSACSDDPKPEKPPTTEKPEHADAHPTEGPHHGSLIELGNEEYHAELVHDEKTGEITIYILDGSAKELVPIDATEIVINAKHDGKPEQFPLTAQPSETDPDGKSSRFVSTDEELAHHLDESDADARLVLKIAGRSYNGKIEHDHRTHNH